MDEIYLDLNQGEVQLDILSSEIEIGLVGVENEIVFDIQGAAVNIDSDTTVYTDDQTLTPADFGIGKSVAMNSVEAKTFTLPEIVDGMEEPIIILKIGAGQLTIDCDDGQYVGFSDLGGGLFNNTSQTWISITLLPVYSLGRYIFLNIVGTWRKL